jgi:hypothetical protein
VEHPREILVPRLEILSTRDGDRVVVELSQSETFRRQSIL